MSDDMIPEWQKELEKVDLGFTTRPTVCPVCGGDVEYGRMEDYGIKPFQSGYCYICKDCGAYVATHKHRTKEALGVLGNAEDRRLRAECHNLFDRHWESTKGRNEAYIALADALNIRYSDCHFGYMRGDMLRQAKEIIKGWDNKLFR